MAEGKIVATLKAGNGYEAPWVTIGADSPEELVSLVDRAGQAGVGASVANAAKGLQATYAVADALGPVTQVSSEPAVPAPVPTAPAPVPQAAPAGPAPSAPPADAMWCPHGQRVKRSGTTNGRNWTGFYCPLPKGDQNQCPVVWGK